SAALIDRLTLNSTRIEAIALGLEEVAALPDPVGRVLATYRRPNGLIIERVATPLGVVGVIYESRPNVTADAGALCLKSGNAVVLRGGSDSFRSSAAIHACLVAGLKEAGLPEAAITRAPFAAREAVGEMLEGLDGAVAPFLLGKLIDALIKAGCAVRGDEAAREADTRVTPATEEDWRTEYLDAIITVGVVDSLDAAIDHIETYGSHHTDCIVTEDKAAAERFLKEVDSAIVLHNASTQFADGGEFGFGAEIGIAT